MGGVTSFFRNIVSEKSMHARCLTERSVDCKNINRQEINIYNRILNLVTLVHRYHMATRIRRRGAGLAHQAVDSESLEWHDACQPCRQQRLRCWPARLCSQPMGSGDYPTPWIRGNDQQRALLESNADASPPGVRPTQTQTWPVPANAGGDDVMEREAAMWWNRNKRAQRCCGEYGEWGDELPSAG
jgi:hypothetical protein